ncbi:MAG: photosystem II biogenesis protein Psp29 [Cyanobacteria bacterium REEB459]|nr:photosystem II biogenesis protein Psp29 [Cyanobacteria bacterium REEB459]
MNNAPVRTVSDAKRDFYTHHTRPINSIYRRVVDELLVEMHLLSVNADFIYDSIYALGVVTTFDKFMVGYRPESDTDSIFKALCASVQSSPDHYRQAAIALQEAAKALDADGLKALIDHPHDSRDHSPIAATLATLVDRPGFKYSRAFGIGLYSLLELTAGEATLADQQTLTEWVNYLGDRLHLPADKLSKDIDLYRRNLEKLAQAQEVMQDILAAERKKREERLQAVTAPDEAGVQSASSTANSPEA